MSDLSIKAVTVKELEKVLVRQSRSYVELGDANLIAKLIVRAERMGVSSHGLHYFLHSVLPLLRLGKINRGRIEVRGSVIQCAGSGGVGFMNTVRCLDKASATARANGIAIASIKNPGKVGAFRVYCPEITAKGQLIIMLKNTAASVGVAALNGPLFGTNPLCIGLPDTSFIYDASTSTVATNRVRTKKKEGKPFSTTIGLSRNLTRSKEPEQILDLDGFLLPYSHGPYWYKSFFLGVAIEAIAALAGGETFIRPKDREDNRLFSDEGMIAIMVDRASFPHYSRYLEEWTRLEASLRSSNFHIPGDFNSANSSVKVLLRDWEEVTQ